MSRSRCLGLVLAFGLVWSLGVTPAAFAAKDTEKQAELKARQAFAASRYDEAIEIFAQLYAETLNPIYLRNIGRCHQKKREPEKAIDAFQDYLAKGKSITASERKEIQGYIKDMQQLRDDQAKDREAAAAKLVFTPAPPVTTGPGTGPATNPPGPGPVIVNVGPGPNPNAVTTLPPPNDPGNPTLVATPGSRPPPEENHPIYTRWWFWTALGVVAAGGVAAALLIPGGVTKPTCTVSVCK
jgi:hypothetical protein